MRSLVSAPWRLCFILAALFIMIGGPLHPKGDRTMTTMAAMAEMLANPSWVPAHALMLAGFVALLVGLILYQRDGSLPDRTRKWARIATIGTALQAVEMALHTAAVVDYANLVAGRATPVLSIHLFLEALINPVFAVTMIRLIVVGVRERTLGSWWIAWLGIVGALAHGASAPLVVWLDVPGAGILFPFLILLALWSLLAGLWPVRASADRILVEIGTA